MLEKLCRYREGVDTAAARAVLVKARDAASKGDHPTYEIALVVLGDRSRLEAAKKAVLEAEALFSQAGRKYAQVNSSSRVHVTFTGRPAAFARRAASIAVSPVCLPPYADPVSGTITRILYSGM